MRRLVIAGLIVLSLAAPVAARGATSSITLNETDPHLGGPATFTIVMPSKYGCTNGLCKSHVELDCSQSGVVVYHDYQGSDVAQTTGLTLGVAFGSTWTSGPADCVAILSYVDRRTTVELARTTFTAAG